MREEGQLRVDVAQLQQFTESIFLAAGLSPVHAGLVADSLVMSDLRGTHSHGIVRVPFLIDRLVKGGANADPQIKVVREAPATALLDGDRALGAVTATHAMRMAMEKAHTAGIGFVAVNNSDFIGACAHYALMAMPENMIGIAWTNGYPGMTPWGGSVNNIGNNPIAFAAPGLTQGPVVLDMALSVAAGGKVRLAAKNNRRIPTDWIIDRHGKPTDNPADLAAGGALLPLGYKGYGLAVFGEILCGVLTGSRILSEIPAWFVDTQRDIGNGHIHMAIDISKFIEPDAFKRRVDEMAMMLKNTPLLADMQEILLPGERAWRVQKEQQITGIRISGAVWNDLLELADRLDVSAPATLQ
ncbi:LDH2 family malate/lactate/ureidoglycolate dehydrogenase [Advenella incenata]|jgi:LDH2 family malate/lactate/ureidoglycolate dehydrogenase|uniref:LDH2 family malate/lactate/ureidoglycolate dehydrogenase n=1 Tax=Advenella incenata TaxID=267800 RepID=A0A4Q7VQE3_9BURK|nr:Ldh family oxidoreductase [Advenella incenata]RZT98408.1 LDH2 family malate/lactate/ureidoglycolate dehydrogenase [Advenella incenata]